MSAAEHDCYADFCGHAPTHRAVDRSVLSPIPTRYLCDVHAADYRSTPAPEPRYEGETISFGWDVEPLPT